MRNILITNCLCIVTVCGCTTKVPQVADENKISPILPTGDEKDLKKIAAKLYIDWADEGDISDKDVKDFLFIASPKGRDWRAPVGPDGYLLRIILLDRDEKPIRKDGRIQAFLVRNHGDKNAEAVCAWDIPQEAMDDYYDDSDWPGYVLPLDWGKGQETPEGCYLLVIRWTGPDGKARLTRNTIFEEAVAVETNTYRKPVVSGGDAAGGGKPAGAGPK